MFAILHGGHRSSVLKRLIVQLNLYKTAKFYLEEFSYDQNDRVKERWKQKDTRNEMSVGNCPPVKLIKAFTVLRPKIIANIHTHTRTHAHAHTHMLCLFYLSVSNLIHSEEP